MGRFAWSLVCVGMTGCGLFHDFPESDWEVDVSPGWIDVAAGGYSSCGVRDDGTAVCWGMAADVVAPDLAFLKVAITETGTVCGVTDQEALVCWGCNDPARDACNPPTGTFVDIEAGPQGFCAERTGGETACWGRSVPHPVALTDSIDVALGNQYSCAVPDNGDPSFCAGVGWIPSFVEPPPQLAEVELGTLHGCGLDGVGRPSCWGAVSGTDPAAATNDPYPDPPWMGPFVDIVSRNRTTCVLTETGIAGCWAGGKHNVDAPSQSFVELAVGTGHVCGLTVDGEIGCWGSNKLGSREPPMY